MFKRHKVIIISSLTVVVVVAIDLITKYIVDLKMVPYQTITVIPNFFNLVYAKNLGAAFSFLNGTPDWFRKPFFFIIPILAMILVGTLLNRSKKELLKVVAFSLVIGGAMGNFLNRLEYGYVIDFLDFKLAPNYHWPSFNAADIAITIAVAMLFIDAIKIENRKRREKKAKSR